MPLATIRTPVGTTMRIRGIRHGKSHGTCLETSPGIARWECLRDPSKPYGVPHGITPAPVEYIVARSMGIPSYVHGVRCGSMGNPTRSQHETKEISNKSRHFAVGLVSTIAYRRCSTCENAGFGRRARLGASKTCTKLSV